ncbi:helix-turn-helix domain-containing protein [Solidesulfovibrio alcoholivorans]|uniref:helix-turn-helix domain-containing protein n=1 Tax=Solidesulfovibrio alcoholivorans TaxID=81406 RepID=UPI0012EC4C2A
MEIRNAPQKHIIHRLLKREGISQSYCATVLGISQAQLSNYLLGYREMPLEVESQLYKIVRFDICSL